MKAKARAELADLRKRFSSTQSLLSSLASGITSPDTARLIEDALKPLREPENLNLALARPAVGVGAVIIDRAASPLRALVGQRKASHGSGKFAFPGGHLECGESFAACASRETAEETGLELPVDRWHQVATTNDWMEAEGLHYVTVYMCATLSETERVAVRNLEPDKCEGWHWLTWDELALKPVFLPLEHFLGQGHHRRLVG
jgi:8-oxo-dGTP diphosphatase